MIRPSSALLCPLLALTWLETSALAQTATLAGDVRSRDGRPLESVAVEALCGTQTFAATTDRNGAFHFDGLPVGECRLTATGPHLPAAVEPVVVGSTTPVRISLANAGLRLEAGNVAAGGGGLRPRVSAGNDVPNQVFSAGRWQLFARGGVEPDVTRERSNAGPRWFMNAQMTYAAPGAVHLTAGMVGRRGATMPLFMAMPLGSDTPLFSAGTMNDALGMPVLWETQLRALKRIKSGSGLTMDLVIEGTNLIPVPRPAAALPTLPARSLRGGLLFGF